MYNFIAREAIASENLEQVILVVHEMFEREMTPNPALVKHVVRMLCEWGYPRLALQIAEKVESGSRDGQRVDTAVWVQILITSADNQFVRRDISRSQADSFSSAGS